MKIWYLWPGLVLVAGCGSGSGDIAVPVRDSAGIQLIENERPLYGDRPPYILDWIPIYDIGGTGNPVTEFGREISVRQLADRRVVVADQASSELRFFDERGQWLKSVGRSGSGPGEFRQLKLLGALPGDTIVAYDRSAARFSYFTSNGGFLWASTLGHDSPEGIDNLPLGLASGRRIITVANDRKRFSLSAGTHRDSMPLTLILPDGHVVGTIGLFPFWENVVEAVTADRVAISGLEFSRSTTALGWDSLVVVGDNERYEFDFYTIGGKLVRRVRRSFVPSQVSEQDVDHLIEQRLATFRASDEHLKPEFRTRMKSAPRPGSKPAYDYVVRSRDGELWVRVYDQPYERERPGHADVFGRDGQWLGAVTLPVGFVPVDIGFDRIVGTWMDQDDVVHVRAYRLVRGAPAHR